MAYIRSANPARFKALTQPGLATYTHGAESRKGYIPLAFQITSPYDKLKALLPHALIAHVNPRSFAETFNKKIERIQTRGGFVEQHWGDDLGEISVDQSTGAFINLQEGLSSILRHRTIAWDRFRDLYDLYHNNGSVYDPYGNIVLQGNVMLMYDRGTYLGYFRTFSVEETETSPFAFNLSWTFKVVETIFQVPMNADVTQVRSVAFQSQNQSNLPVLSDRNGNLAVIGADGRAIEGQTAAEQKRESLEKAGNDKLASTAKDIQSLQGVALGGESGWLGGLDFVGSETTKTPTPAKTLPTKSPSPTGTPAVKSASPTPPKTTSTSGQFVKAPPPEPAHPSPPGPVSQPNSSSSSSSSSSSGPNSSSG